jgi:phage tail tape-measure protein
MADLIVEIGGDVSKLNSALGQANKQVGNFANTTERENQKVQKSFGSLNQFATGALAGIAAGFSVNAIVGFGKAIIDTTAQFQKFEAVLSNTLGSSLQASVALDQITEFASNTPFAVDELTAAFVKLANQGFRPTINELTSLGDLASSTGKSFDQLAEAVLDAQVGEFERLKEFGIRAKQSGDNVTFTFKGVETQVLKSDEAIRGYILSLGEAEGVSGSMAKISETVGGKISNLGDNFTQIKKELGDSSSGLIAGFFDLANVLAGELATSLNAVNVVAEKTGEGGFTSFLKQIAALTNPAYGAEIKAQALAFKSIDENAAAAEKAITDANKAIEDGIIKNQKELEEAEKKRSEALAIAQKQRLEALEAENKKVLALQESYRSFLDSISIVTDSDIISRTQSAVDQENKPLIQDFGNLAGDTAPITEFADTFEEVAERTKLNIGELSGAFQGLGSAIGKALGVKPAFGQFLGALIPFAAKLISTNFAIAGSSAVAGASNAALATGPAAPFTLPGFIAASLGVIGSAFAAFGKGGGGSFSGSGGQGVGGGQASNFSGGSTSGNFDPNRNITLSGGFEISGDKLRYVLNQSEGFRN